jgi:Tol biopolymer transport system component
LTAAADDCSSPALSPDGTQLAMVCAGGSGLQSTRLEVASLIGTKLGVPRVLVSNCLCASPAWAPDGSGLVYYAPADVSGHFELWWIAGAGGPLPKSPKQVTQTLDLDATSPPAWSAT